ncbi:hypothetical protein CYMTET_19947 [Cymbomonas tetramitiformis]|uniref:Uncharacterized protein n=1 Tax=Cymbomonas tetramitiformis TaxID=36881 RepID=A0AAE0G535_9CHLO|nr:hypothetical protein CYMTET_19947 [Cymbomonas tetramitiformis]
MAATNAVSAAATVNKVSCGWSNFSGMEKFLEEQPVTGHWADIEWWARLPVMSQWNEPKIWGCPTQAKIQPDTWLQAWGRIEVYWEDDDAYYPGAVQYYTEEGKNFVLYDDEDEEMLNLAEETFRLLGDRRLLTGG